MSNRHQNNDPKSSPMARGKRLKTVRMMAGLTRNGLEDKYGISASTIQSWEAAKAGGLTERGVQRVIPVLQQEGIFCTSDWLLYGVGSPPQPTNLDLPKTEEAPPLPLVGLTEDKAIIQELLTFRELNTNVIDMVVTDDGMQPYYNSGDYVAGKRKSKEILNRALGLDCIVETSNNEILLRRLKIGSKPGVYTLVCTNPDTTVIIPTLYDLELISAAPIIWHRRHDPVV
jgi:HTH-type transcriptional regulator, cell division transcriptional repressor